MRCHMGLSILFMLVILSSIFCGFAVAVLCILSSKKTEAKVEAAVEEETVVGASSEAPDDVDAVEETNPSCLSKIDKSASFSDYTVDVEGLDGEAHSKKLRESQDDKYKRKKQEG